MKVKFLGWPDVQAADCPAGEIELPAVRLIGQNGNGQFLVESTGTEKLCAPPDWQKWIQAVLPNITEEPLFWVLAYAVLAVLVALAFLYHLKTRRSLQDTESSASEVRKDETAPLSLPTKGELSFQDPFPKAWKVSLEDILKPQLDLLRNEIQDVSHSLREVRSHQLEQPSSVPQYDASLSPRSFSMPSSASLTELVSRWWSEGSDRDQLDDLLRRNSSIKRFRSSNVQDSMRSQANRTFLFQSSESGMAEWLGRLQGDLFLVPGDPKLFQTGDALKFLGALFEGLGPSLSDVRFRRVVRACRLKKEPGTADRYRLIERGQLELEGGAAVEPGPSFAPYRLPQPAPAVQSVLPEGKLEKIVQQAVEAAVPVDLPSKIQNLSQQIQALAERGLRQATESPRPDPNVASALGSVREDLSALAQRLRPMESLAQLVEALRGSLSRIEEGLRDLRHAPPLPALTAAPVAPAPIPPPPTAPAPVLAPAPELAFPTDLEVYVDAIPGEDDSPFLPSPVAFDRLESPEQLWSTMQVWWPKPVVSGLPEGYQPKEPAVAYVWNLQETMRRLSQRIGDRGWQVDIVHVKPPENTSVNERILQIHAPHLIGDRQILCACAPSNPFTDALLFQFALRVCGDHGRTIAVFPTPSLRLMGSIEGYARLAGGSLPERASSLVEILRPAILSHVAGDLYTVALPMQGRFQ